MNDSPRDENTLDHKTWPGCVRELLRCFNGSAGLFFLSLNEIIAYFNKVIDFITQNKTLDPQTFFHCTATGRPITFAPSPSVETITHVKLYKGAGNAQDDALVQGVYCDSFTAYNPGTNFPVLREARSISEFKCSVRTIDTDYLNEVHCITKQIGKFSNETPAKQYDLYTQRMILAILLFYELHGNTEMKKTWDEKFYEKHYDDNSEPEIADGRVREQMRDAWNSMTKDHILPLHTIFNNSLPNGDQQHLCIWLDY